MNRIGPEVAALPTEAPSLDGLEVIEHEIEHATCSDTLIAGEIELAEPAND